MQLHIHKVRQGASGGSYVVIYEAQIDIVVGDVAVEISRVEPKDAFTDYVAAAKEAIRIGAERALKTLGLGALIRVQRLVIHDVDFSPQMYERHTEEELARLLST